MSAEPDPLAVVNQLRDLAADPMNRRAIVQDQGCLPGLILFLDHTNPQVVYSALLAIRYLAECRANREKLKGELGMMLSLQNVMQKSTTPGETKLLASEIYELLQASGGAEAESTEEAVSSRRKAQFFLGSSNKRAKTVILQIDGLDDSSRRSLCEEALLKIRGVISFTFQMTVKRCIVRIRSDLKAEALASAIASTQVMKAQQVVKGEDGDETLMVSLLRPSAHTKMSPLLLLLLGLLSLIVCVLRGRKRRDGEPPLIKGWIPFIGKALEFGRDAHAFLEEQKKKFGDIFTVHIAGKYMTFIMDPFMYPSIIKHGRQLDFHKFSEKVAPVVFGYPPVRSGNYPGLHEEILRSFKLLQGDNLTALTESMMGNLMLVFRQDHMNVSSGEESSWKSASMYDFCNSVMFEATFHTIYGRPASSSRHSEMGMLKENFDSFDTMFPLLVAKVPIRLLRRANASRKKLINYFLPHQMSCWSSTSQFVKRRRELFDQYGTLRAIDKAAHHFAILWASVANTVPACFWAMYYLVSHPVALEVIRQEILDMLNVSGVEFSRDKDVKLGREQLDKLIYLESAINESLRLSSASMNIRVAEEDFCLRLNGERSAAVRKGDIIVLYPQSLHMDPAIYEEPQTFRFDRYIQDGREKTDFYKDGQKLKYYRMPFGSGSTMCPGRYFAINEIKQFLCVLLIYFDIQLEEGQTRVTVDTGRAGLGILLPATNVRFRYRLRTV